MDKVINSYETLFVVDVTAGDETVNATVDRFTSLIAENAQVVVETAKWGKTRLAYPINDMNEGYYVLEAVNEFLNVIRKTGMRGTVSHLNIKYDNGVPDDYLFKQGIGKQMLTVLEEEAKGLGIKTLYLEVRESNQSARKLYTSFGFEEDGIRRDFYELPKENAVLMHKSI